MIVESTRFLSMASNYPRMQLKHSNFPLTRACFSLASNSSLQHKGHMANENASWSDEKRLTFGSLTR